MSSESRLDLYGQATLWAEQLRSDPSFTISDAEELKGHLLDIAEELVSQGYCEAEAFAMAASRLGEPAVLREEFDEVNTPVIQLRKTVLVLSGILFFFLFYFFVSFSARLLVLALGHFSDNEVVNGYIVKSYTGLYLLLIAVFTAALFFSKLKMFENFEERRIKPAHTFILFFLTLIFALINAWLDAIIRQTFDHFSYTFYYQYTVFDYLSYLFPVFSITSFMVLYKKYNHIKALGHKEFPMKSILLIFSGILFYFLLRFLLHSSARILFSALQYHSDDPALNIRRTWSFVMTFQLLFIFLTTALYFLDKHLVSRLRDLHLRPVHTLWLLFATIFLAILDRCFLPIAARMIRHSGAEIIHKYWDIFIITDISFPFVLGACFLLLFSKYYRDNIRIGN